MVYILDIGLSYLVGIVDSRQIANEEFNRIVVRNISPIPAGIGEFFY